MVGPHAGWRYSGDAAAQTYRWLAAARPEADLVVVFGSHRGPQGPDTIFLGEAWDTPLGALTVARDLARALAAELQLREEAARPGRPDNGVELHLPFVRHFFPRAELLMLGLAARPASAAVGARVAAACVAAGRQAVFVGSTDLTHYGPSYHFTPHGEGGAAIAWVREHNDRGFISALLRRDRDGAVAHAREHHSACCPGAAVAALAAAEVAGGTEEPALVSHYLSCDVDAGDRTSFVGYAGIVL